MSSANVALKLDGLCKSFGRIRAVDNLSLEVHSGGLVGFLGPNGAGKSTSLYMMSRLVRPCSGRIEIFGNDVWGDFKEAMLHVGAMVETPAFYEYLSGRRNLELTGRLRGVNGSREIDEILERIGLYERRNDKVGTYSHGMKQRLGLGMALLGKPKLLLLDEPTNGMDPEATREILRFIREKVRQEGMAVFLSSHLLFEVEEYCDKVFVIDHGSLVASGEVKDILKPYQNVAHVSFKCSTAEAESLENEEGIERVKIISRDTLEITLTGHDTVWLNKMLLSRGYEVSSLSAKQKTLKDFFLSITGDTADE
ncbi:MAG: ABC transporter ATP-binding protein [Planctomycetota bacterium]